MINIGKKGSAVDISELMQKHALVYSSKDKTALKEVAQRGFDAFTCQQNNLRKCKIDQGDL